MNSFTPRATWAKNQALCKTTGSEHVPYTTQAEGTACSCPHQHRWPVFVGTFGSHKSKQPLWSPWRAVSVFRELKRQHVSGKWPQRHAKQALSVLHWLQLAQWWSFFLSDCMCRAQGASGHKPCRFSCSWALGWGRGELPHLNTQGSRGVVIQRLRQHRKPVEMTLTSIYGVQMCSGRAQYLWEEGLQALLQRKAYLM